jgi:hypothetical protein
MKKIIVAFTVIGLVLFLSRPLAAQPHPASQQNGSSTGGSSINGSSGAPIGSGAGILVVLSIAYGISRYKKKEEEV